MPEGTRVQRANQALDAEIAALKEQVAEARRRRSRPVRPDEQVAPSSSQPAAPVPKAESASTDIAGDQNVSIDALSAQIERLQMLQSWMKEDPTIVGPVGRAVGAETGQSFRKNLFWSVILGVVFLLAGWLLSVIATPATFGSFFVR